MSDAVFRRESAVEYFKELVDGALSHQGLATQELTAYYVVQLLASFLQRGIAQGQEDATPLAVRLARALDSGGVRQRASLKENADLLRLYEKWLRTGSPRSGQLLAERGVVPNAAVKGTRVQ